VREVHETDISRQVRFSSQGGGNIITHAVGFASFEINRSVRWHCVPVPEGKHVVHYTKHLATVEHTRSIARWSTRGTHEAIHTWGNTRGIPACVIHAHWAQLRRSTGLVLAMPFKLRGILFPTIIRMWSRVCGVLA
jgi:hypothetical protein